MATKPPTVTQIKAAYKKIGFKPTCGCWVADRGGSCCALSATYLADKANYKKIQEQQGLASQTLEIPKCCEATFVDDKFVLSYDDMDIEDWAETKYGKEFVLGFIYGFDGGELELNLCNKDSLKGFELGKKARKEVLDKK